MIEVDFPRQQKADSPHDVAPAPSASSTGTWTTIVVVLFFLVSAIFVLRVYSDDITFESYKASISKNFFGGTAQSHPVPTVDSLHTEFPSSGLHDLQSRYRIASDGRVCLSGINSLLVATHPKQTEIVTEIPTNMFLNDTLDLIVQARSADGECICSGGDWFQLRWEEDSTAATGMSTFTDHSDGLYSTTIRFPVPGTYTIYVSLMARQRIRIKELDFRFRGALDRRLISGSPIHITVSSRIPSASANSSAGSTDPSSVDYEEEMGQLLKLCPPNVSSGYWSPSEDRVVLRWRESESASPDIDDDDGIGGRHQPTLLEFIDDTHFWRGIDCVHRDDSWDSIRSRLKRWYGPRPRVTFFGDSTLRGVFKVLEDYLKSLQLPTLRICELPARFLLTADDVTFEFVFGAAFADCTHPLCQCAPDMACAPRCERNPEMECLCRRYNMSTDEYLAERFFDRVVENTTVPTCLAADHANDSAPRTRSVMVPISVLVVNTGIWDSVYCTDTSGILFENLINRFFDMFEERGLNASVDVVWRTNTANHQIEVQDFGADVKPLREDVDPIYFIANGTFYGKGLNETLTMADGIDGTFPDEFYDRKFNTTAVLKRTPLVARAVRLLYDSIAELVVARRPYARLLNVFEMSLSRPDRVYDTQHYYPKYTCSKVCRTPTSFPPIVDAVQLQLLFSSMGARPTTTTTTTTTTKNTTTTTATIVS